MKKWLCFFVAMLITVSAMAWAGKVEERRLVSTGMAESELFYKLGQPDRTEETQNVYGAVAEKKYIYYPAGSDMQTIYTYTVSDGKVTNIDKRIVR